MTSVSRVLRIGARFAERAAGGSWLAQSCRPASGETLNPHVQCRPQARGVAGRLADIETSARNPDEGDTITGDDAAQAVALGHAVIDAINRAFTQRGVDVTGIDPA